MLPGRSVHLTQQVRPVGGSRDDDPLGAGFEMLRRRLALGKDAGAFERHIDAEFAPRQFRRVALGGDADLSAADIHPIVPGRDLARETAMHAVIPKEMRIGCYRAQIVDPDDGDILASALDDGPQNQASDAAKTVDRNPNRHGYAFPLSRASAAPAAASAVMPKCL